MRRKGKTREAGWKATYSPQEQLISPTRIVNKYFFLSKYHITQIQGTFFKYQAFLFNTQFVTRNKFLWPR
jgi:hypothetical protein